MRNIIVLLVLLTSPLLLQAQDSCRYLSVKPDTFFINQYTDSVINERLVYTGNKDISYSSCSFVFTDTASIDIKEAATTTGVSGPFIFSRFGGYRVIYKHDSITRNTVVHAMYHVYHAGASAPVIDCEVPVIFVINSGLVPETPGTVALALYPNPVKSTATVKADKAFKHASVLLYNSVGQKVLQKDDVTSGYSVTIDCSGLPPGMYSVVVVNEGSVSSTRMHIITR